MARQPSTILTEAENRIMEVLWKQGEASVQNVVDAISSQKKQAYTTIQTFLGIMKDKGFVDQRKEGRAFLYRPLLSRAQARTQALKHLIGSAFGGSTSALAQHLLKDSDIDEGEISALEQAIDTAIKLEENDNV
ncbi:MAG: BlaI/MecI/CopY family transcriptional regulator [Kordiimonadaceae bacterium]|jgi:BlaI family transcriptional regulator, penicillinase repressor|nr:BlaI/MecI/CopY family transcriptional regulator [Kordiimonadaceae bacterium]MBT6330365.1 BlaI/MecI/CopY family transcriptional regulator [Kordiimonadaceae bacterium]MBT7583854.1 BlaI/MecI/CopY family transcriptional regulator [Kordiimonadaceae bacterium]